MDNRLLPLSTNNWPMNSSLPEEKNTLTDVEKEEDITKPWILKDEYRFAPKIEGDPWRHFLDPILAKEKIRCDGWKDEVGNLLIFAGLFSAVVTAFIIESYKTLKPDPNDAIVGLLARISSQLNSTAGSGIQFSSNLPSFPSQSFSPGLSAIRVNIFWFLSLILSLATVLIGIVALQWLREYQSYPGKSPMEDVAIYHMRSEGMNRWHVWKILTALPLLLQMALTLFLAGIIDFLHALGNVPVTAFVASVTGLVLLFVVITTTFPTLQAATLQVLSLLPFQLGNTPSQCPYKSPQSRVMFASVELFLHTYSFVKSTFQSLWTYAFRSETTTQSQSSLVRHHISTLWGKKTWEQFDLAWLDVRDASSRRKYDNKLDSPENWEAIYPLKNNIPPLFDIMSFLRQINGKVSITESASLAYSYHCFSALSLTLTISSMFKEGLMFLEKEDVGLVLQRNAYFLSLYHEKAIGDPNIFGHVQKYSSVEETVDAMRLQHDHNMLTFLNHLPVYGNDFDIHADEIRTRIQCELFGRKSAHHTALSADRFYPRTSIAMRELLDPPHLLFIYQYMEIVKRFFQYLSHPDTVIMSGDLHADPGVYMFLHSCAWLLSIARNAASRRQKFEDRLARVVNSVDHLLDTITDSLMRMYPPADETPSNQSLSFYCAAILLRGMTRRHEEERHRFDQHIEAEKLRRLLKRYKTNIIDQNGPDVKLEERFLSDPRVSRYPKPFSMQWWSFLDIDQDGIGPLAEQVSSNIRDSHVEGRGCYYTLEDLEAELASSPVPYPLSQANQQSSTPGSAEIQEHPHSLSGQELQPSSSPSICAIQNLPTPMLDPDSNPTNLASREEWANVPTEIEASFMPPLLDSALPDNAGLSMATSRISFAPSPPISTDRRNIIQSIPESEMNPDAANEV